MRAQKATQMAYLHVGDVDTDSFTRTPGHDVPLASSLTLSKGFYPPMLSKNQARDLSTEQRALESRGIPLSYGGMRDPIILCSLLILVEHLPEPALPADPRSTKERERDRLIHGGNPLMVIWNAMEEEREKRLSRTAGMNAPPEPTPLSDPMAMEDVQPSETESRLNVLRQELKMRLKRNT
jgi:hypothetical protein